MLAKDSTTETVHTGICPHALKLSQEGIGAVSRMCRESVLQAEISNPNLPQIHAEEGSKFTTMALRIAPPNLVAHSIRADLSPYPTISDLGQAYICKAFDTIFKLTASSTLRSGEQKGQYFRHNISDAIKYFDFCNRDSDLLLGCFYMSLMLQKFVDDIYSLTTNADIRDFGAQFNAANLMTALPMALCTSLLKIHGDHASSQEVDNNVIADALATLHKNGLFALYAKGMKQTETDGVETTLQCPMQGYLYNLICTNQILEPILASISKSNTDIAEIAKSGPKDIDPLVQLLLRLHENNSQNVKHIAGQFSKKLRQQKH